MKLKLYETKDKLDLYNMLIEFSIEVFKSGTVDLDKFVSRHTHIYLAIISGEVVGFASFLINDYFGLREETVGYTFAYVKPEHRRSKALHLMSIQAGLVARDLNMPLEICVASKASELLTRRLKGEKIYTAFIYPIEECMRFIDGLKEKVRIEE